MPSEHVSHSGAGDGLHRATAAPNAQRHLNVLAAPLGHLAIVLSALEPPVAPHRQQAARHAGHWEGVWDLVARVATRCCAHPIELQVPLEAAVHACHVDILRGILLGENVDDRDDDSLLVLHQPLQEGFQPLSVREAVGFKEDDDRSVSEVRSSFLGLYQSLTLVVAVVLDLGMELRQRALVRPVLLIPVIDEEDLLEELWRGVSDEGPDGVHGEFEALRHRASVV
mmetsp:Transcript_51623/g.109693  ORF Transcript_51623/g.109693 Transcript_51623/m.109693 type:complete len:226 (+) Transcript_51623:282-959(+)